MTNKKSIESRRKLLKSIALGSGAVVAGKSLPESWNRPVVDSVMLPAHARTSIFPSAFVSAGTLPSASLDNGTLLADIADKLVPEAKANSFGPEIPCIINNGNGTVTVDAIILGTIKYQKTVTVGAAKELMDHCPDISTQNYNGFGLINDANALIYVTAVEVRIDTIDGNAIGALFVGGSSEYVIDLPPGPCTSGPCSPILPSDRSIKENFTEVDEQEILRKVASLPIETWNYTDREQGVRHIGPMAQDFMASFNVGDSDRHIHMVDANGVNLAAIKALNKKLEEKDSQIIELQEQLAEVLNRLDKLG